MYNGENVKQYYILDLRLPEAGPTGRYQQNFPHQKGCLSECGSRHPVTCPPVTPVSSSTRPYLLGRPRVPGRPGEGHCPVAVILWWAQT